MQARKAKEIQKLLASPPEGVCCWQEDESSVERLIAQIEGPKDSPYENGLFQLEIHMHDKYPLEPPFVRFKTQIYHPNIDSDGRICLELLKMPPKGHWRPSVTVENVLITIRWLMGAPNPDDPLMPDIARIFSNDKATFNSKAKDWTKKYAIPEPVKTIASPIETPPKHAPTPVQISPVKPLLKSKPPSAEKSNISEPIMLDFTSPVTETDIRPPLRDLPLLGGAKQPRISLKSKDTRVSLKSKKSKTMK